jgi:hypothetical protein
MRVSYCSLDVYSLLNTECIQYYYMVTFPAFIVFLFLICRVRQSV